MPDLEIFSKYFGLSQWEKIIFCQNAYFRLKMIFRPCFFFIFFRTLQVGLVGFEKCGKFRTFFFFLKPSLTQKIYYRRVGYDSHVAQSESIIEGK